MLTLPKISLICLMFSSLILISCARQTPQDQGEPAVIEDRSEQPVTGAGSAGINRAVAKMESEAEYALAQRDWQGAIVTAERGLRIDRRNPSLYLTLAKAYRSMGDEKRAHEFAEQGKRYAKPDTSIAAELEEFLLQSKRW